MDVPDEDFFVSLHEVKADLVPGAAVHLGQPQKPDQPANVKPDLSRPLPGVEDRSRRSPFFTESRSLVT